MATDPLTSPAAPGGQQPFTLYAAGGRIYARNVEAKLVDLGALTEDDAGYRYRLDGNGLTASGLSSPQAVLEHLAPRLRFLFLDGQFTAVADAGENEVPELRGAPRLDILLDELAPGERIQDASV